MGLSDSASFGRLVGLQEFAQPKALQPQRRVTAVSRGSIAKSGVDLTKSDVAIAGSRGFSGLTISPKVYIAAGISGQMQLRTAQSRRQEILRGYFPRYRSRRAAWLGEIPS